jgi:dihydrofolate synthase/folylpolyglutamate synthase
MTEPHAYLHSLQPMAVRLGLERMERALDALGHPEAGLRILHVAGTNGKGSTCAMAAAALRLAGHRTGLYTSPHLVRFNERIAVDGAPIDDGRLGDLIDAVRRACPWHDAGGAGGDDRLTYFEFATVLALLHFAQAQVGAVVLEVGLGGRFDATNAVRPVACAVTRIGLDHTELLGSTLAAIAGEKAGIFKPGVPAAVAGDQPPEALAVLRAEAARRGAPLVVAPEVYDGPIGLAGPHQRANAALAAAALRLLDQGGVTVPEQALRGGIASAAWPGRLERVGGVLLDGAHNPDGAAALAAALPALFPGQPVELVFGVLGDKDHRSMLAALAPAVRSLHLVTPRSPRARPPESYLAEARTLVEAVDTHATVAEAIACARQAASRAGEAPSHAGEGPSQDALVCVAGSLYLVGEARALLA